MNDSYGDGMNSGYGVGSYQILANNVLTIWFDWPGLKILFSHYGLFGFKKLSTPLEGAVINLAYIQLLFYFISFIIYLYI